MDSILTDELLKRIVIKPGLMAGKPVIRGLRFPVIDILEMLASGMSHAEILEQHPVLEEDDIRASLKYASYRLGHTKVIHAA
jgi:uncharacterized protein (DUF433 family)